MSQPAGIVKGDALQRLSSAGFIIGAVLILAGTTWVARIDLSDPVGAQGRLGEQIPVLQAMALLLTFGWWAVLAGAAGVTGSISVGGAAWARLGFYFLIMGTTLWTLGMSLDVSYAALIASWLAAPAEGKEAAHTVLNTLFPPGGGFGRGLFPLNVLSNWLAFALLGTGMIRSAIYPRWLGGTGAVLGASGIAMGIVMTFIGREPIFNVFTILAFLTILWVLLCGLWAARKAW
jgi:hypothetical protein